jgi:hypothetical protein
VEAADAELADIRPVDGRHGRQQHPDPGTRHIQKNLDLLLERKGEYVLIKGEEIVGYFPDEDSALEAGAERFGTEPALVKQIAEFEEIATFGGIY